jgi:YspA, cpYpsA-related SLOG family
MGNPTSNSAHIGRDTAALLKLAAQRPARLASGHIVIVCGGHDYVNRAGVFEVLDHAHVHCPITLLVHGAHLDPWTGVLVGTDRYAEEWAIARGVPLERHPADRATWGKSAGSVRRRQMAQAGAHGLIAFPGGAATESMVQHARRCAIEVWRPFG